MFEGMRRHASWIVLVIAGAFILSMAISGITSIFTKTESLGVIAGEKISFENYRTILENAFANHARQNPDSTIDDEQAKKLNNETWDQIVQEILLSKEIKARRIKVTQEDILTKIKEPAEDIKTMADFQTDDEFDINLYFTALEENPDFFNYIERRIKGSLPYEKLYNNVKAEIVLTEEDAKQQYIDANNKADADIIYFEANKMKVNATDSLMKIYYETNKEDFKKGPARKLKYVKLVLEASEEDKQTSKAKADSIFKVVSSGMDFAEAAKELSEGPSADKGGDLGYFTKERMVAEFSDAAFSMKNGEISQPVLTRFGWHVIKVYDRKTNKESGAEEVKASHILIKSEPSESTIANLEIVASDLFQVAKKNGLEKASETFSYEISETEEFYEDSKYIKGIGSEDALLKFAFSKKVGKISEPLKDRSGNYFVTEISFKIGDHYQDFEAQKKSIKLKTEKQLKSEKVKALAQDFIKIHKPSDFLTAAKKLDWEIIEATEITTDGTIKGLRKNDDLKNAILAGKVGENTELISDESGAYIAVIKNRELPDLEKFEIEKETLLKEAQEKEETKHLNDWWRELRNNAKIEDNRKNYYSL